MATGSYSPVPIALGSPTTETEEGRAFFQERVGRFGMWVFFISGGFYVMALGLGSTLDPRFNWSTTPFTGGELLHLLGTLVVGGVWLVARTTTLPGRALRTLDAAAVILASSCFALMGGALGLDQVAAIGNAHVVIDARSDLYALGAVGYFLLTGAPVFESGTVVEIFAHHLHTAPTPPSQRATQRIPAELEAAIVRCLSKDPEARPKDAGVLRRALADCPCSIPWSIDGASRWWATYEAERGQPQDRAAAERPARHETVMVDLADRVARP